MVEDHCVGAVDPEPLPAPPEPPEPPEPLPPEPLPFPPEPVAGGVGLLFAVPALPAQPVRNITRANTRDIHAIERSFGIFIGNPTPWKRFQEEIPCRREMLHKK